MNTNVCSTRLLMIPMQTVAGVTTVLTMAFLAIDNRRDLPKVSYSTALDYFVGICFGFVLASVIQFASVHFFTKHGSGEVIAHSDSEAEEEEGEDGEWEEEEEQEEEEDKYDFVKVGNLDVLSANIL